MSKRYTLPLFLIAIWLVIALPAMAQPIEISVTICCGQLDRLDWLDSVAEKYMAENPNVIVTPIHEGGLDELITRIAGGVGPDLIWTGQAWGDTIDFFTPLTQFQKENAEFFNQLVPGMIDGFSFNGVTYAIPFSASTRAMAINKDLLDQAGFAFPDAGWTWGEALDIARKTTRDIDGDGLPDVLGIALDWWPWNYFAYNGSIYSEDGLHPDLDNDISRAATEIWLDAWSGKLPVMPSGYASIPGNPREMFVGGQLAMIDIGIFDIPNFRTNATFDWDVQELPLLHHNGQLYQGGSWSGEGYALFNDSKHPEEAFRFAKFMLSHESVSELAATGAIMPAQIETLHSVFVDPGTPPANMMAFVNGLDYQMAAWAHPAFGRLLDGMFHPIWNTDFGHDGSRSVDSLLRESQEVAERILAEFWATR